MAKQLISTHDGNLALVSHGRRSKRRSNLGQLVYLASSSSLPEGYVFLDGGDVRQGVARPACPRDQAHKYALPLAPTGHADKSSPETAPQSLNLADADNGTDEPKEEAPMGLMDNHTDSNADGLTPVREAQRLLGASIIGSGLTILRDHNRPNSRERFVRTAELEKLMSHSRGSRTGAGQIARDAISSARKQRASANRIGQQNDRDNADVQRARAARQRSAARRAAARK